MWIYFTELLSDLAGNPVSQQANELMHEIIPIQLFYQGLRIQMKRVFLRQY
jgi:hypothetical protein